MWGIQRVVDTAAFSPMFSQALAARLAADAAISITNNRALQSDMWNLYGVKLAQAAARDGGQGANEIVKSNNYITARARGGL